MEEKIAQLQAEKLELENKFLDPDFLKSKDYLEIQKRYNKICRKFIIHFILTTV